MSVSRNHFVCLSIACMFWVVCGCVYVAVCVCVSVCVCVCVFVCVYSPLFSPSHFSSVKRLFSLSLPPSPSSLPLFFPSSVSSEPQASRLPHTEHRSNCVSC